MAEDSDRPAIGKAAQNSAPRLKRKCVPDEI